MTSPRGAAPPSPAANPTSLPPLLATRFGDLPSNSTLGYSRFIAPIVMNLKMLMIATAMSAIAFVAVMLIRGREYEARVTLATVGSSKLLGGLDAGLASSLLAGASMSGIQSTPALFVQLADLPGVLYPISVSPIGGESAERVGNRIATGGLLPRLRRPDVMAMDPAKAAKLVESITDASFDRQTGLITLSVQHRDTALARYVADRLVEGVSRAFMNATRAQASELRSAQTVRVDSAERRVRIAEDRLVDFSRENRVVNEFSSAYLLRQRLEREASMARTVYTQAVSDQEAAIARELQDTPAVVVVDPVPPKLPAVPRRLLTKTILWTIFSWLVLAGAIIARDLLQVHADDPETRLRAALERWPRIGRLIA